MVLGIDKAVCLCLDKRHEEWHELWKECEKKGIEFEPFLVGDGQMFSVEKYGIIYLYYDNKNTKNKQFDNRKKCCL